MCHVAYTVCHGDSFRALRERYYRLDTKNLTSSGSARKAVETLSNSLTDLWYSKDRYSETIYQVDRFLENEVLPHLSEEQRLLENAESLRRQALGSAVAGLPFESIARYEAHLDRKFERTLSMLLKLKTMKAVPVDEAPLPTVEG